MEIVIIGAGAAGLMAAAGINAPSTILERNEKAGKKIYITGKGRCNLTNDGPPDEFLKQVLRGGKFMQSAIYRFPPRCVMDFFIQSGLNLKTERGNRVFPVSDKASDVTKALVKQAEKNGAKFIYDTFVSGIKPVNGKNGGFEVFCKDGRVFHADILVVAAGGKSYPATGSDGSLYGILASLGHSVSDLFPSLVPFVLAEEVLPLKGLSFKNVGARVRYNGGEAAASGELLFTDSGVSGPVILTLSAITAGKSPVSLSLDFRPSEQEDAIDKKLLKLFGSDANKEIKNILPELLPKSLSSYIISYIGIDPQKKANSVTKAERAALAGAIKNLTFKIRDTAGFNEAVVTCGGVDLKEIDPKSMQSKLYDNLYIVGETLDIDAVTGGYNLQLAWSTALAAAESINAKLGESEK